MLSNKPSEVLIFSPSGALLDEALLDRAHLALQHAGFASREMPQARLRIERFAGDEAARAQSICSAIESLVPSILMASRGGYGLSRLLPQLDFKRLATQLEHNGHVLCGHSDVTSLQLALLANGAPPASLLHGPMACFDFGSEQGADATTLAHFLKAVNEKRVDISWQPDETGDDFAFANWQCEGPVWGGNLTLLCSLLGTPWLPEIRGGILVLEDVNEPVYKIERMLLQLLHAGVLGQQQAVLLGNFSEPKPGTHDNGYQLKSAARFVQQQLPSVPLFSGFPFGHCTPKACWFQGVKGSLSINDSGQAQLMQAL